MLADRRRQLLCEGVDLRAEVGEALEEGVAAGRRGGGKEVGGDAGDGVCIVWALQLVAVVVVVVVVVIVTVIVIVVFSAFLLFFFFFFFLTGQFTALLIRMTRRSADSFD